MPTLLEKRRRFAAKPECQFVSVDVFIERLTGHDRLIRADEPAANLLGLRDEKTGARYLIPLEEFLERQVKMDYLEEK